MQIVARDKRSVDLIVKELVEESEGTGRMRFANPTIPLSYDQSFRAVPKTAKLWTEIQELPAGTSNHPRRLNFIAQHISGRVYTASLYEKDGMRSSEGNRKLKELLGRVLGMYGDGKLKGDLVIHKTAHNGCHNSSDNWPIKICLDNKQEHWILTGVLSWIYAMRDEKEMLHAPDVHSTSNSVVEGYESWCSDVGLADKWQCKRIFTYNGVGYSRWVDRMRRYVQRIELVNILRDTVNLSYLTGPYGEMGWSDYISESNTPRFGAWCYKKGRLYYFTAGESELEHKIKINANRNTDIGGIF